MISNKKTTVILTLCLLAQFVHAQQHQITDKDTLRYYMRYGAIATSKDSAEHLLVIMPADSSSGQKIYPVFEYDKSSKMTLSAYSTTQKFDKLNYNGAFVTFFSNGRKSATANYSNGKLTGKMMQYYPNGQLYTYRAHADDGHILLIECRDSTGVIRTQNGSGKWIIYDNAFKKIVDEGAISDSLEQGVWNETILDTLRYTIEYRNGKIIARSNKDLYIDHSEPSCAIELAPECPGFWQYISHNIRYPDYEKQHHIQGKVIVQFIVEQDGSLGNIKILSSPDENFSNEVLRVLKLSPQWQPGIQNNIAVRTQWTMPLNFTLDNH